MLWFVATLGASADPTLYSAGRVGDWVAELFMGVVVLAFPTGRLTAPIDRLLALLLVVNVCLLYIPSALLVDSFPVPNPATLCTSGCPANAFNVLGWEPAWVDGVLRPVRETMTVLLALAVIARLAWRAVTSSRLMRRALVPLLVAAIARMVLLALSLATRPGDPELAATFSEMLHLGVALIAGGFLLGLLNWRVYVAESLQTLAERVSGHLDATQLRAAIARALGDPSVEILRPGRAGWIDSDGRPATPPAPGSGRQLTEIGDGGRRVAAIVHDELPGEQAVFVAAVATIAMLSLDNDELDSRLRSSSYALAESRARLAVAADDQRRRIQRDLHDGAQQRLIALRIRLELARELAERDPAAAAAAIAGLGDQVDAALADLRDLAAGVYPPLLADRGLVRALEAAASGSPVPVSVIAEAGFGRFPRTVESAVYFCCLEAMQNVAKHAAAAGEVVVSLAEDDGIRFAVEDDGRGFDLDATVAGTGLVSMRDRLEAIGGSLLVESAPGSGTRVAGHVPVGRAGGGGCGPARCRADGDR